MAALHIDIGLPRRDFELRAALSLARETLALVGPSGAGKTSLLRAVAGLERPRSGTIVLGDEVWFAAGRVHLPPERRRVGYLPQDFGLFAHLDVSANVRFAGRRDRPDLLARFQISHLRQSRPGELSGGERQRVALARAVAREPRVLLLDEPLAALDTDTRRVVRGQLLDLLDSLGLPALLVTHSFRDAALLASRVAVLDQGKLVQLDRPAELLRRPKNATVAALIGANVIAGSATPTAGGSRIALEGGGELVSSEQASGPVTVAVAPWDLELCPADGCVLVETVTAVAHDEGRLVVRLSRFTVQLGADPDGLALVRGERVGVRAPARAVRVLDG